MYSTIYTDMPTPWAIGSQDVGNSVLYEQLHEFFLLYLFIILLIMLVIVSWILLRGMLKFLYKIIRVSLFVLSGIVIRFEILGSIPPRGLPFPLKESSSYVRLYLKQIGFGQNKDQLDRFLYDSHELDVFSVSSLEVLPIYDEKFLLIPYASLKSPSVLGEVPPTDLVSDFLVYLYFGVYFIILITSLYFSFFTGTTIFWPIDF